MALMLLGGPDYEKCARRIIEALKLQPGESILLKIDPPLFDPLLEPLKRRIREAGAYISGAILSENSRKVSPAELSSMRALFNQADVFIWLPEREQGNTPAGARALAEWLDAKRGRAVHFHWGGGTYPIADLPLPSQETIDSMYIAALDADSGDLERLQNKAIAILRSGLVQITTPEGTDIHFDIGDRPVCKQVGDASAERMKGAHIRIDRDVELPAGALRVAPIEISANGTIFLPIWKPVRTQGRNIRLTLEEGRVVKIEGTNAADIERELTEAGGAAKMFRELALGFNPQLKVPKDKPFIPYYGYGAGVVRLSLGDNEEMGGANRGGGIYWNFLHNATVSVGNQFLAKDGELVIK